MKKKYFDNNLYMSRLDTVWQGFWWLTNLNNKYTDFNSDLQLSHSQLEFGASYSWDNHVHIGIRIVKCSQAEEDMIDPELTSS